MKSSLKRLNLADEDITDHPALWKASDRITITVKSLAEVDWPKMLKQATAWKCSSILVLSPQGLRLAALTTRTLQHLLEK